MDEAFTNTEIQPQMHPHFGVFGALICPDTGVFGSQKQPKREVIKLITSILPTIYPLPRKLFLPTGRKAGKGMFFNNTILILLKTLF